MNTVLCILLQCSSVNSGNFHSKLSLPVTMETACFLALLTKRVSLTTSEMKQNENLKKVTEKNCFNDNQKTFIACSQQAIAPGQFGFESKV